LLPLAGLSIGNSSPARTSSVESACLGRHATNRKRSSGCSLSDPCPLLHSADTCCVVFEALSERASRRLSNCHICTISRSRRYRSSHGGRDLCLVWFHNRLARSGDNGCRFVVAAHLLVRESNLQSPVGATRCHRRVRVRAAHFGRAS